MQSKLAAAANIVDSRQLSFPDNAPELLSLLLTVSSSCNQLSLLSLPLAIGGCTCIFDRSVSPFV